MVPTPQLTLHCMRFVGRLFGCQAPQPYLVRLECIGDSGRRLRRGSTDPWGLGGGSRPTGVLVQRWLQLRGPGRSPERFFKPILMDFEAKSTYHTTYRTSLES